MITIILLNILKVLIPVVIISFIVKTMGKFIFFSLLFLVFFALLADKPITTEPKTIIVLVLGTIANFISISPVVFFVAAFKNFKTEDNETEVKKPKHNE